MDIVRINESQEIPITKITCHLGGVGAFSQRATVKKCPLRTFVVIARACQKNVRGVEICLFKKSYVANI